MGANLPKQFLELGQATILAHCLRSFKNQGLQEPFILVAHRDSIAKSRQIGSIELSATAIQLVEGGPTRHASTLNGLRAILPGLMNNDVILIHDVARPLISTAEIDRLKNTFLKNPACEIASLAGSMPETIVQASGVPGLLEASLDRDRIATIKTPQAVRVSALHNMLEIKPDGTFTDLLTWGEACQKQGYLVQAGPTNLKITRAEDLPMIEMLRKQYCG